MPVSKKEEVIDETIADALESSDEAKMTKAIAEEFGASDPIANTMTMLPPEVYKTRAVARIKAEAQELNSDETIPGGRYRVNGKLVDCDGKEIAE